MFFQWYSSFTWTLTSSFNAILNQTLSVKRLKVQEGRAATEGARGLVTAYLCSAAPRGSCNAGRCSKHLHREQRGEVLKGDGDNLRTSEQHLATCLFRQFYSREEEEETSFLLHSELAAMLHPPAQPRLAEVPERKLMILSL